MANLFVRIKVFSAGIKMTNLFEVSARQESSQLETRIPNILPGYHLSKKNKIILEIGFGMGDTTFKMAQEMPGSNFLAVEVHSPGVGSLLNKINLSQLENLKIIQHDAIEVMNEMIPDKSLDGIHIFFPDPWPKKKHHKRRLLKNSC